MGLNTHIQCACARRQTAVNGRALTQRLAGMLERESHGVGVWHIARECLDDRVLHGLRT